MEAKRQTSSCSDGTSPDIYGVQNISQNILVGDKRVLVTPLLPGNNTKSARARIKIIRTGKFTKNRCSVGDVR